MNFRVIYLLQTFSNVIFLYSCAAVDKISTVHYVACCGPCVMAEVVVLISEGDVKIER